MLTPTGSSHTSIAVASEQGIVPRTGGRVHLRALLVIGLLSLAAGGALTLVRAGQRSPAVAPANPQAAVRGLWSLPASAWQPVARALGAGRVAYQASSSAGGVTASNPAQGFGVRFSRTAVSVQARGLHAALGLRAIGYGTALAGVGSATPTARGDRVRYAHRGVGEWYANGPLGLEQGFTLAHPPRGAQRGPLTLAIVLSGDAHPSLAAGSRSLLLSRPRGPTLTYGGLHASDARGRALRSWMQLDGRRLLLRVDARGARFPVQIDPFMQQGEKLTGSGESGAGRFGVSVALSSDGSTALVGGSGDNGGVGAAWLFTRSGETWTQQAKLTASGEVGAGKFGTSLALSSDGGTALIGAPADGTRNLVGEVTEGSNVVTGLSSTVGIFVGQEVSGPKVPKAAVVNKVLTATEVEISTNVEGVGGKTVKEALTFVGAGAAWVFTRSGSTWTQQAKMTGGGEVGSGVFGERVALASDGNTALVSGPNDNNGAGAGWVFTRSGEEWTQQAKLTASEEIGQAKVGFGASLSGDGDTVVLGGYADNSKLGAAWVFTRSGEEWTQQAKLTASEEIGAGEFGESVALSGEGDTALIGGEGDNSRAGAAWVFTRSGEEWTQQAKLTGSGQIGRALFANHSVALTGDGNTAMVSGWGDNTFKGAVWVFTRAGVAWSQDAKLTATGESGEGEFGVGLAVSADGSTALIGGPGDKANVGAVWPFTHNRSPLAVTGGASSVTTNSATLNATVNPEGEAISDCHFEYGTSTEYGSSVPCSSTPPPEEAPQPVSAPIGGLNERTTYHFRIVATNPTATSYGADRTFTTQSAPGEPPEYGKCVKLAKGVKGNYSSATCTTAATAEKFSYEWFPGPGPKPKFTMKIKTATTATLETVGKQKVLCTGQTGSGEYTGRKTVGNVVLQLTGCELAGAQCTTLGAAEGEITTRALHGELGLVKASPEGPLKNTIGIDLAPVSEGGAVMEFACGPTQVVVRGSVIVPVTRNAMKLSASLPYVQSQGKQKPESFAEAPRDVLESSLGEAPFKQTGLKLTTIQTNEEAIEASSVA